MKKLRLIKPWKLRAVRQRLCDSRELAYESALLVPCRGPQDNFEEVHHLRSIDCNDRVLLPNNWGGNIAPVSYIIHPAANPRM